ncbi:MAG: arginase [Planctomycetota bacterium]|nr:MAG: arginase [Planctomycetota bacterium]
MSSRLPTTHRSVRMLGVPMDLGAGRRGVDMGPSAVRYAGLGRVVRALGHSFEDLGDIGVPIPERREPGTGPKYLREIVRACERLAPRVESILDQGAFPVVVGGDHSIALGTVTGVAEHFRKRDQKIGLVWIDAHADMNTDVTSPSGNIHGMPLSALLGYGAKELVNIGGFSPKVDPERTVLIGIRSVDDDECELVIRSGVHYYEMMKIDAVGMGAVICEAVDHVSKGAAGVHVSLDVDGIDPEYAPGVGTPVPGGINLREAHLIMEVLADSGMMCSLEVTEVNPILDTANITARLVSELIGSALGKKVMGPMFQPAQRAARKLTR